MFFSKILPVPCGTFSPIYKSEIEKIKKVSNIKGLRDIGCTQKGTPVYPKRNT